MLVERCDLPILKTIIIIIISLVFFLFTLIFQPGVIGLNAAAEIKQQLTLNMRLTGDILTVVGRVRFVQSVLPQQPILFVCFISLYYSCF